MAGGDRITNGFPKLAVRVKDPETEYSLGLWNVVIENRVLGAAAPA